MNQLNIYVRQDLKMRKGKMAAQSAHAAMKLLFDVMDKTATRMILQSKPAQQLKAFLANPNIKINMVQDENALHSILDKELPFATIIDSGRTEFHGVPTLTCAAQGIFTQCETSEIHVPAMYGKDIKAKQIFVFNKDFPLSKEMACELSVLTCLQLLFSKMKIENDTMYFDLQEEGAFVDWILNAFAKIALSTKTLTDLDNLVVSLESNSIKYIKTSITNNVCVCIEPCYPENIDVITGSLSLI